MQTEIFVSKNFMKNNTIKRILIIDKVHSVLISELNSKGYVCDYNPDITYEELIRVVSEYCGLIVRSRFKINKEIIDHATNLKFIGRVGAGMESIDVEYAKQKDIICYNSPEGNRDAVGEHTLGLLLDLFNKITKSNYEVRNGEWKREANRGIEIMGKTIAIIGYGNMGSSFAKRLSGFDANVIAYDKYKKDYSDNFVKEVGMEEVFETADVVSLHIPFTAETDYLINKDYINQFEKNIYLLNTSRGKIVKSDDLLEAIKLGKIVGAGLDVIEYEDMTTDNIAENKSEVFKQLLTLSNVVITPHVAGWSIESNYKLSKVLADKIV